MSKTLEKDLKCLESVSRAREVQQGRRTSKLARIAAQPVLDGFAATVKIRELESEDASRGRTPIIALTANVSTESEEKCRAAGMDHFLPKPFKFAGMLYAELLLTGAHRLADLQALLSQIKGLPPG